MGKESFNPKQSIRDHLTTKTKEAFFVRGPGKDEFYGNYGAEISHEGFLNGLGVKREDMSSEELQDLEWFKMYAGKRLLVSSLRRSATESLESRKRIIKALGQHARQLKNIARHDLVHTMIAYALNSQEKTGEGRHSLRPEFIKRDPSESQALAEELPAVLWTDAFGLGSPWAVLLNGQGMKLLQNLVKSGECSSEESRMFAERFRMLDVRDFAACLRILTDMVFAIVRAVNEKEHSDAEETGAVVAEGWRERLTEAEVRVRVILERALVGEDLQHSEHKLERTVWLYVTKAKEIHEQHARNPRAHLEAFMEMGKPLFQMRHKDTPLSSDELV